MVVKPRLAASRQEAIDQVRAGHPDLIIIDVPLGLAGFSPKGESGLDVAEALWADGYDGSILLMAVSVPSHLEEGLAASLQRRKVHYLAKLAPDKELLHLFQQLLGVEAE